jgi:hypothetical protein
MRRLVKLTQRSFNGYDGFCWIDPATVISITQTGNPDTVAVDNGRQQVIVVGSAEEVQALLFPLSQLTFQPWPTPEEGSNDKGEA